MAGMVVVAALSEQSRQLERTACSKTTYVSQDTANSVRALY